jgi:hypothetical protein
MVSVPFPAAPFRKPSAQSIVFNANAIDNRSRLVRRDSLPLEGRVREGGSRKASPNGKLQSSFFLKWINSSNDRTAYGRTPLPNPPLKGEGTPLFGLIKGARQKMRIEQILRQFFNSMIPLIPACACHSHVSDRLAGMTHGERQL